MAKVEFRDGEREVPDHLKRLMAGLDTVRFTFEEAKALADQKLVRDHLNEVQSDVIKRHFRNTP